MVMTPKQKMMASLRKDAGKGDRDLSFHLSDKSLERMSESDRREVETEIHLRVVLQKAKRQLEHEGAISANLFEHPSFQELPESEQNIIQQRIEFLRENPQYGIHVDVVGGKISTTPTSERANRPIKPQEPTYNEMISVRETLQEMGIDITEQRIDLVKRMLMPGRITCKGDEELHRSIMRAQAKRYYNNTVREGGEFTKAELTLMIALAPELRRKIAGRKPYPPRMR